MSEDVNVVDAGVTETSFSSRTRRNYVLAAVSGNFVEWYDFSVYAFFAVVLAKLFFPTGNDTTSLLATFATFGIAFVTRPFGALLFGRLGDRIGRRAILAVVVLLMSGATALIGVLPGYAAAGVVGPSLLVLARILQGFSAGGEYGSATAYLVESAPRRRRGLTGSWAYVGIGFGLVVGAGIGLGLSSGLSEGALSSWGWRIPFLLAIPFGLIGFYLRSRVDESPEFVALRKEGDVAAAPLTQAFRTQTRGLLLTVGLVVVGTVDVYVGLLYLPTYLIKVGKLSMTSALGVNLAALVVFTIIVPFVGRWSDSIGRRPLLIASALAAGIAAFPAFLLISTHSVPAALGGQLMLAIAAAIWCGVAPTTLVEIFPAQLRSSALSVGYSVAVSVFGGLSPFAITYLTSVTNATYAPVWYLVVAAVITMVTTFALPETAHRELART